jgi:hypothetical protein
LSKERWRSLAHILHFTVFKGAPTCYDVVSFDHSYGVAEPQRHQEVDGGVVVLGDARLSGQKGENGAKVPDK